MIKTKKLKNVKKNNILQRIKAIVDNQKFST